MPEHFNIVDHFLEAAGKFPAKAAIVTKDERISFAELGKQVKDTSAYFLHKGIRKGDRVLVFVPMNTDLYRIVLALFNIGATAVFLDEWVSKKRMELCCEIAQCNAFIGIFKVRVLSVFSAELRKIPIRLGIGYRIVPGDRDHFRAQETVASDTALITFTTGSTGTPKAAKRTHGFLHEQFEALLEKIDPQPGDIDMPALPIVLLINLGSGCTSVIPDFKASKIAVMDAGKVIRQIQENGVTRMVASPFFVKKLATHVIGQGIAVPSLQKIFTGGAPVFPSEARLYLQAFPNVATEIVYGSTEAEPISSISAAALVSGESNMESGLKAGFPYRKANVRIIEISSGPIACATVPELDRITLPAGKMGEIIVSGPHVLREYFNNDEALRQNKIFIDDTCWHRTGDSGYLDENGQICLTGRCNMLIHTAGKVIAPFIYEDRLQAVAGVEMGTVMELDGDITLIVELEKNANQQEVARLIADAGIEFRTRFVAAIPRDQRHNSKIDYSALRKML